MAIEHEFYSDGVYQIHVLDQTLRLDFTRLQPNPETNNPIPKPCERAIMNLQGFLRTYRSMTQTLRKLEELGIVQRGGSDTPPAP